MNKRNRILRGLLVLMLAGSLAGCSGGNGGGSGTDDSGEKVKITFMSRDSGDTPMAKVYEEQIAAFMKDNPDIEVQNDSVYEEAAYNNKLKVAISTGETPNIFYYPAIAGLTEWAKSGVLLDLTEALEEDAAWKDTFLDGALDTYRLDEYGAEGIYALPNELNVDGVFYNKALFQKAGITETPETMDDFYEAIEKLNAAGITPVGVGGKDTWVMGHIFNNILAKRIGTEGIRELGVGKRSWTDPEIVECLQITKDLKEKGAFMDGFEGIDVNTQMSQFLTGEVAMISHSSPIIPEMYHTDSEILDDISFFPFPYFADKPEYKDTRVVYTSGWMLSGTMDDAQKEATLKLVKYMTTPEAIQQRMDAAMRVAPYKNIEAPEDAPQIFKDMVAYTDTIADPVGEYFDYDTCATLVDVSRNGILNMMLSNSAEDTAGIIQEGTELKE